MNATQKWVISVIIGCSLYLVILEVASVFISVRVVAVSFYHYYVRFISPIASIDPSKGSIFAALSLGKGYTLPKGTGGCIWDVGANDGTWESNSHYLIHSRKFNAWLFEPDPENYIKLRNMYGRVSNDRDMYDSVSEEHLGREAIDHHFRQVNLFNFALSDEDSIVPFRTFPMGHENTFALHDRHNQFDHPLHEFNVASVHADLLCRQQRAALRAGRCEMKLSPTFDSPHLQRDRNLRQSRYELEGRKQGNSSQNEGDHQQRQEYDERHRQQEQQQEQEQQHHQQQPQSLSRGRRKLRQNDLQPRRNFTVLSIDVEGMDERVFFSAHAAGCRWDVVIIESLTWSTELIEILGYRYITKVGYNHIFTANSTFLATNDVMRSSRLKRYRDARARSRTSRTVAAPFSSSK